MPAKIKVKIAIITTGVSKAQTIPSTEPLYRAASSRLARDSTRSKRRGSCQSGRQTERRAACAEINPKAFGGASTRRACAPQKSRAHHNWARSQRRLFRQQSFETLTKTRPSRSSCQSSRAYGWAAPEMPGQPGHLSISSRQAVAAPGASRQSSESLPVKESVDIPSRQARQSKTSSSHCSTAGRC